MTLKNIWLIAIFSPFFASCQEVITLPQADKIKLDQIVTRDVPEHAPGIAAGVVMNGEISYVKYAGYANLADSALIDMQSRFNIASNGKQFTALGILSLIEAGQLSLEDDLRLFFPELYPKVVEPIKIEYLLNHTSGIRDVYDLWSLQGITWWKNTFSNQDALDLLSRQAELNFAPGSDQMYSNSNYILLAEIIAKVSGQSFVSFMDDIFAALNMPNTSFSDNYKTIQGPIAQPYFNFNTWKDYNWVWNVYGDGNIFSTLQDQLEWEKILQTKVSSRFSKELLAKCQSSVQNSTTETYGYGLEFGNYKGTFYKYHEGVTGAWKAYLMRFPEQKISIVTMTNSGKVTPTSTTFQMADLLLEKGPETKSLKEAPDTIGAFLSIDEIVGHYEINNTIMEFVKRGDDLYLLRSGRNDMKLNRALDNVFQQWNDPPFKQEFIKNEDGSMQVTFYYTNTPPFTLTRIDADFSNFDFNSVNGSYINQETGVAFSLGHKADKKYLLQYGERKLEAVLLSPEELFVGGVNYRLRIVKELGGNYDLLLSKGRIRGVRFVREE